MKLFSATSGGAFAALLLSLLPYGAQAQEAPNVDTLLESLANIGPDTLIQRVNELKTEAETKSAEAVALRQKAEELDAKAAALRARIEAIVKFTSTLVEAMTPKPPDPAPAPAPEPAPAPPPEPAPAPEAAAPAPAPEPAPAAPAEQG